MPIDDDFLEILRCPRTRQRLQRLDAEGLGRINERIDAGECVSADGEPVGERFEEGLITVDGKLAYGIDDGIPVMLPGKAIPVE